MKFYFFCNFKFWRFCMAKKKERNNRHQISIIIRLIPTLFAIQRKRQKLKFNESVDRSCWFIFYCFTSINMFLFQFNEFNGIGGALERSHHFKHSANRIYFRNLWYKIDKSHLNGKTFAFMSVYFCWALVCFMSCEMPASRVLKCFLFRFSFARINCSLFKWHPSLRFVTITNL